METRSSLYDIDSIAIPVHQLDLARNAEIGCNNNVSIKSCKGSEKPHTSQECDKADETKGHDANLSSATDKLVIIEEVTPATSEELKSHSSTSFSATTVSHAKTPIVPLQPIKRITVEERPTTGKKRDAAFVFPNGHPPRISRMSALSPEENERLQAANARKIEAVKQTMAEVLPSTSKGKRPSAFVDPAAPPRKRGRPKGSVNKPRVNGAQQSVSLITTQTRSTHAKVTGAARTVATQSCMDVTEQGLSRRRLAAGAQSSVHAVSPVLKETTSQSRCDGSLLKQSSGPLAQKTAKGGTDDHERTRACATTQTDLSPKRMLRTEVSKTQSDQSLSDDGYVTPPLRIAEETVADVLNPLLSKSTQLSSKARQMRLEKDADAWTRSLIKELSSLLSSSQDDQKLRIACALQRIVCEERDLQHLTSMVTLLETEVNERFQQQKEEFARMLREQREKCTRNSSRTSDLINSLRNEMVQLIELHGSLRQTVTKHSTEMEAIRTTFNTSYDSVQQIAAELSAKLESLRRNGELSRMSCPGQFLQNSMNMCSLSAAFPPPPPPPPLPPPASPNRKEDEMSTPENAAPRNRQNSASDAVPDHLEEPHLRVSSGATENGSVVPNPLMPLPNPFYGPLLPPPQKMMFDYFQLQQLQQAQQPVIPPLPPLLSNIMNQGNQMPLPFQPPAHEHHNVRTDGYNQRYHNNMRSDYSNKSRR